VVTPLRSVLLLPAAHDLAGVNYQIIAPPSVAASIQVFGGALRVVDGTGNAVNFASATSASSFNLGSTSTGQFFRYTIRRSQ
jgi:hypothetical protein